MKPNMDSFDEVFAAVKEYCKEHVVIATYNLFINDIEPVSFDGNKAILSVRSEFVKTRWKTAIFRFCRKHSVSFLALKWK